MVNCTSDTEFLAKLYCIRLAFNVSFVINLLSTLYTIIPLIFLLAYNKLNVLFLEII